MMTIRLPSSSRLARIVVGLGLLMVALAFAGPASAHGVVQGGLEIGFHERVDAAVFASINDPEAGLPCPCCVAGPCCCVVVETAPPVTSMDLTHFDWSETQFAALHDRHGPPSDPPPRSRHG